MKILDVKQNTDAWLMARAGIPTASEFGELVTPEGAARTGQTPETYFHRKVYERIMGYPEQAFGGGHMERGQLLETRAIPFYEFTTGEKVDRVGFVTTDDGRCGASPDGLIGEDGGLECKCPSGAVHIKYLLDNRCPKEYIPQVQGSMFVTGRAWWAFQSYHPYIAPLVVKVIRDESFQAVLRCTLAAFVARLDEAEKRIRGMMPKEQGRQ